MLLAFPATLIRAATAVAALLWFDVSPDAAELQRWTAGEPPHFTLSDSGGATVALNSQRGSVTIVHFFATWCEPCREELPALNRLSERSGGAVKISRDLGRRTRRARGTISSIPAAEIPGAAGPRPHHHQVMERIDFADQRRARTRSLSRDLLLKQTLRGTQSICANCLEDVLSLKRAQCSMQHKKPICIHLGGERHAV